MNALESCANRQHPEAAQVRLQWVEEQPERYPHDGAVMTQPTQARDTAHEPPEVPSTRERARPRGHVPRESTHTTFRKRQTAGTEGPPSPSWSAYLGAVVRAPVRSWKKTPASLAHRAPPPGQPVTCFSRKPLLRSRHTVHGSPAGLQEGGCVLGAPGSRQSPGWTSVLQPRTAF